jgi:hypothetical protein
VQKNRPVPLDIICCVSVLNLIVLKEKSNYQFFAPHKIVLLVKITEFLDRLLQWRQHTAYKAKVYYVILQAVPTRNPESYVPVQVLMLYYSCILSLSRSSRTGCRKFVVISSYWNSLDYRQYFIGNLWVCSGPDLT